MSTSKSSIIIRNRHFFFIDILIFVLAAEFSFLLRLELSPFDPVLLLGVLSFVTISIPTRFVIFFFYKLYRQHWRTAGVNELITVTAACFSSGLITVAAIVALTLAWPNLRLLIPLSIPFIDALLVTLMITMLRFSLRTYHHYQRQTQDTTQSTERTLIIGAGHTGIQILDALQQRSSDFAVLGFLDDTPSKVGAYIRDVPVLGTLAELRAIATQKKISLIVIAIPSAPGTLIRRIASECQGLGIRYKIVPGLYELVSGQMNVSRLRPVSIDDLLRRDQVALDMRDVAQQIGGRCVLITGAGGSIGSELARQIAQLKPSRLLLVGHGENSLFALESRLRSEFPDVVHHVMLGDVRDMRRMTFIFEQWQPAVVFHAAAHKHVPMLETNVIEAFTNNVVSTRNLIALCNRFGAERMVLISTDKAVNPTSVMGTTKRVAELMMLNAASNAPQRFAVVRFGNVLGSRGSVIPTFQRQIEAGGPITITSPDITRYFMNIPEAVLLVLKASVLTECGSLFVLNMGTPIRIVDLASDLIRLNGLEPERDIEINVIGLRPGEKLYEELFWAHERYYPVEGGRIFAVEASMDLAPLTQTAQRVDQLMSAVQSYDEAYVWAQLQEIARGTTGRPASTYSELQPVLAEADHTNGHSANGHSTNGHTNGHVKEEV